ncbi:MAG: hypothetical protein IBX58_02125 [Roseovarius sp.]|nr:hypothetical protein [Roseovarius sp.]
MKPWHVFSVLALAGCGVAFGPVVLASLGPSPVVSGGYYTSGGGIDVAVDLRERDGRTLLCGAWSQSARQSILTAGVVPGLLGSGSVFVDGRALVRGLNFMSEVPPRQDYAGVEARCVLTERPWRAGDEARRPVVRIPRQIVHVDADDGGRVVVYFIQSGPSALR